MATDRPDTLSILAHDRVLVPGSTITLRLLPSAHGALLREAGRNEGRFGVCLLAEQVLANVGVEACIGDFSTATDGALMLRVHGRRRFRLRESSIMDGQVTAAVDWCESDPDEPLRPEHALLAVVLEAILAQAGEDATVAQLDDSAWVGWRLVEWLPLSIEQRQSFLEEDDPFVRLDRLLLQLS
jgi:Lon protease-like protein